MPFPYVVTLDLLPLLEVTFTLTCTTLSTGSLIIFEEISVFSISILFLYFTLYVTSLIPFTPFVITEFCVAAAPPETSFVIVSNGISS